MVTYELADIQSDSSPTGSITDTTVPTEVKKGESYTVSGQVKLDCADAKYDGKVRVLGPENRVEEYDLGSNQCGATDAFAVDMPGTSKTGTQTVGITFRLKESEYVGYVAVDDTDVDFEVVDSSDDGDNGDDEDDGNNDDDDDSTDDGNDDDNEDDDEQQTGDTYDLPVVGEVEKQKAHIYGAAGLGAFVLGSEIGRRRRPTRRARPPRDR